MALQFGLPSPSPKPMWQDDRDRMGGRSAHRALGWEVQSLLCECATSLSLTAWLICPPGSEFLTVPRAPAGQNAAADDGGNSFYGPQRS